MYTIDYSQLFILFFIQINMINSNNEDNQRLEILTRSEYTEVRFLCDLTDVAWWKRPNLLATRYGIILPKFRSKMSLERTDDNSQMQTLHIHKLQSNDSGIYECETLGAIRQFNLTVIVRLATVELGVQYITSYDSTNDHITNQSLILNNRHINLREEQLIRLTCVVSRALPAAILHFPFDIDYRIERNSTTENDDKTYRTILVLILRVNRYFHKRLFHCQATQIQIINNENSTEQIRIRSNTLQMDVAYSPICSYKNSFIPQVFTGIHRPINLTCHMNNGNPSKINFTWHLPNGNIRLGYYLNTTSSYLTLIPNSNIDFGKITCRAQNDLGLFGECFVNMNLGGIPDPIESCHYTYLNSTLTVNCMAGFHQGDEDFFCYMYKRQDNGSYSEHARLKGNCAFILPDLKPESYHDFRVFTKNKFGDNFDRSYSIKIGKPKVESFVDKTRLYWPYMTLFIIGACLASFILICCSCHKLRKSMYNKRKTKDDFEDLTYQNHNSHHSHINSNGKTSLVHSKQNGNGISYPVRPYRSKDHLISSEPSTLHRNNPLFKTFYSNDDEIIPNRRSILKETDLDYVHNLSNGTIKTLPINRNRTLYSPTNPEEKSNNGPLTIQRRSSFQAATQLNSLDFYTASDPFYFLDKQLLKSSQRNHYSPESDYYREKRRDYSPYLKTDLNHPNNFIVENHLLINGYIEPASNEHSPDNNFTNEFQQDNYKDERNFILNNDDRNEDRYRHDGIFV